MYLLGSNLASKLFLVGLLVLGGSDRCNAVAGVDGTEISSDGCVDKNGFEACLNDASSAEATCVTKVAGNADDVFACGLLLQINQMNCYMSSCWNKVYSCEYQFLAAVYTDDRGLVTPEEIPFWPAPDNAPGGCGCNFGQLYFNYTDAISQGIGICAVEGRISADTESGCTCCAESAAVSAFYAMCPDNDLSHLGFNTAVAAYQSFEKDIGVDCSTYLGSCVKDYGVAPAAGGKFLDVDNLPSSLGNKPFTTTGAAPTSPPGGPTMTWSILGTEYTIVAESYRDSSNPAKTTVNHGSTATDISGSSSNSRSSDSTNKSSANRVSEVIGVGVLLPVLVGALWMHL